MKEVSEGINGIITATMTILIMVALFGCCLLVAIAAL